MLDPHDVELMKRFLCGYDLPEPTWRFGDPIPEEVRHEFEIFDARRDELRTQCDTRQF